MMTLIAVVFLDSITKALGLESNFFMWSVIGVALFVFYIDAYLSSRRMAPISIAEGMGTHGESEKMRIDGMTKSLSLLVNRESGVPQALNRSVFEHSN